MKQVAADQMRGGNTCWQPDLSLKMNQIDTRPVSTQEIQVSGQGMAGLSKPRIAERGRVATQRQRRMTISKRCTGAGTQPLRWHIAEGE